jgi:ribosome maturation factor RimP
MTIEAEDKQQQVIEAVWALLEPVAEAEGFELVEVEYRRESPGWVLRIFIDHIDGVTVDHCARISRLVGDILDVHDLIPNSYHLEVSSPGLNRPLRKARHYQRQVGRVVELRTRLPFGQRRNFKGVLLAAGEDRLHLDCDGQVYEIPLVDVEKARLRYFDSVSS